MNAERNTLSAANHRLGTRFEGRPSTLSGHPARRMKFARICELAHTRASSRWINLRRAERKARTFCEYQVFLSGYRDMPHQPRPHFFIVALSLIWLFAAPIGAQGEESRTSQSPSVTMQAVMRNCSALRCVSKPLEPCRVAAMRSRAADRIDDFIANHKIDVCTIGPERIVTR